MSVTDTVLRLVVVNAVVRCFGADAESVRVVECDREAGTCEADVALRRMPGVLVRVEISGVPAEVCE